MKKRTRVILTFMFLILLVIGLYFFSDWFSKTTGLSPPLQDENSIFIDGIIRNTVIFFVLLVLVVGLVRELKN